MIIPLVVNLPLNPITMEENPIFMIIMFIIGIIMTVWIVSKFPLFLLFFAL